MTAASIFALAFALATPGKTETSERAVLAGDAMTRSPVRPAQEPGVVDPFHVPPAAAAQLNADGKVLYRQGHWEEARKKYRAAEAADPDFLAPALNVACSFVRQERYADSMAEVLRLLDRAYLPWSQEILSAADLGALKVRPEGKQLRAALDKARARWAEGLSEDVILVARLRAPLKLAEGEGEGAAPVRAPRTLVLGLRQEVFAWSPRTLRYRQLTSEEGRVIAVARSRDQRRIAYVTAEKLIRNADGGTALRGVMVTELELDTLAPLARGPLAGDVRRVGIQTVGTGFAYQVQPADHSDSTTFAAIDGTLAPRPVIRSIPPSVTVTGAGVVSGSSGVRALGSRCAGVARDVPAHDRVFPSIAIAGRCRSTFKVQIGGPHGAGLAGLPIP